MSTPDPTSSGHKKTPRDVSSGGLQDNNTIPTSSGQDEELKLRDGISTDDCWLYAGPINKGGYGYFRVAGGKKYTSYMAHRAMYEFLVGPIPEGLVTDHLCRVRHCVNPKHLEPVTDRENILRGIGPSARNAIKTHCLRGHPLSGNNVARATRPSRPALYSDRVCRQCHREQRRRDYFESVNGVFKGITKLTEEQVVSILQELKEHSARSIARKYGVGSTAIERIRDGKRWKHIPREPGVVYPLFINGSSGTRTTRNPLRKWDLEIDHE